MAPGFCFSHIMPLLTPFIAQRQNHDHLTTNFDATLLCCLECFFLEAALSMGYPAGGPKHIASPTTRFLFIVG